MLGRCWLRTTVEADILHGVFIDPDAGNITLSKYALETWLPAQTFSPSTRERVESRLRLHILPDIGGGKGLGSYSLSQLARSPSVIQAWLRGLQTKEERPLAPSEVTLPWQKPGGKPVTVRLMFTKDDEGAIWRNDFNRYAWHPALKAAGLAPCRENGFHQLRHHFASVVLRDGVDVRTLAEYLGHSDPAFMLRVYCHLMPGSPDRVRQAIDRAFSDAPDHPGITQQGETGL